MKRRYKLTAGFGLTILLTGMVLFTLCLRGLANEKEGDSITLLFTTDIHSNDVPHLAMLQDGDGVRLGGFARLKTAIDENWVPNQTLLLDSGDFSMGTLYQNYTESEALELTLMDKIGYDAIALGNHDFEITEDGLKSELTTYRQKGGKSVILASNLTDGSGLVTAQQNENPLFEQGVQNYTVIERNGLRIGIFALMGKDAIRYTTVTSFSFSDPVKCAKAMVTQLRDKEQVDLVIALSHTGIMPDGSFHEDTDIAKAVDGIDVILSGHEHVPLPEIVYENDTMIVCAGTALDYLGRLQMSRKDGKWSADYELLPVLEDYEEDTEIAQILQEYTDRIDSEYLKPMGVQHEAMEDFAVADRDFPDGDHMCLQLQNYSFGALLTDAYFDGLQKAGVSDVSVAVIPCGFVRNGLYQGNLQMMDAYNVLSYGISPYDGSSGAPICVFYLTGNELYNLCETSASLSSIMNTVQMLMGGIHFDYSNSRMFLNRVYQVEVRNPETGEYEPVQRNDDKLYKIATSWTALQNLSLVGSNSYGLVTITPKDKNGNSYTTQQLPETVVFRDNGMELKEWYALYAYMDSMPTNQEGLSVIDAKYQETPNYMTDHTGEKGLLFRNSSKAFGVILILIVILLLVLALFVFLIVRLIRYLRRRKKNKYV